MGRQQSQTAGVTLRQGVVGPRGNPTPTGSLEPQKTAGQEIADDVFHIRRLLPCATFLLLHGVPYKDFFSYSRIFYEDIKIDEPKNN